MYIVLKYCQLINQIDLQKKAYESRMSLEKFANKSDLVSKFLFSSFICCLFILLVI